MTVPDYGPYLRHLLRSREVGRRSALDLACGTGITAAVLAEELERVHAVDLSPHMLAAAKKELVGYSNIEYLASAFQEFELCEPVDVAVCSGDALNYAQSFDELAAAASIDLAPLTSSAPSTLRLVPPPAAYLHSIDPPGVRRPAPRIPSRIHSRPALRLLLSG